MSIFAGIFCRNNSAPLADSACDTLRRSLSREARDVVREFRDARVFLAKVDIGAFEAPAFLVRPEGSVSLLAGEPLLATGDPHVAGVRSADLELLHVGWDRGDWSLLKRARGVFCAAHYHPGGRLTLLADKLGIRPLYYWVGDDYVVFATALRVLEALAPVPKRMDLRAVTEMAVLGVPLGDRTPHDGIRLLRAAEIVQVSGAGATRSQYWRWDEIQPSDRPEPELLREAYQRFTAAVACRLRGDTTANAFLSGGLDSRCVVAALRSLGARVRTFNFGFPGTQDHIFGAQFARAAGTEHHHVPMEPTHPLRFSFMMAEALATCPPRDLTPERPRLIWSGDGGSVGTGCVYETRDMVDLLRAGQHDAAISALLAEHGANIPRRAFRRDIVASLVPLPHQGIREELADLRCQDAGRAIHLFLLLNDQRRHLGNHFEDLDLHRLEFQPPFFDSDFIQVMVEIPIDLCLYHRFYAKWLALFPSAVTSAPWQTYPGHVPCPLPIQKGLHYQWQVRPSQGWGGPLKRALLRQMGEILRAPRFPHDLLRRRALRLASWIYRVGLRDYAYVLRVAGLYYTYWKRCDGRWVAPGAAPAVAAGDAAPAPGSEPTHHVPAR